MAKKKQSTWVTIVLIIVAVVSWYLKKNPGTLDGITGAGSTGESISVDASGNIDFDTVGLTEAKITTGEFTSLEGCKLADHRNNDGDSFYVTHPKGKDEVRLYFVDTAESRLHKYNGERIADQGEYFGGLSQKQTTDIGIEGKKLTLALLASKPFTMLTKWEMDPSGKRPHVYVLVEKDGKQYYLHEILAKSGLVRTRTRGAALPDGKTFFKQRDKVKALEAEAKREKRGAWGVKS